MGSEDQITRNFENLPSNYKKTFSTFTDLLKCIGIDLLEQKLSVKNKLKLIILNIFFLPFICFQICLVIELISENFLKGASVIPIVLLFILDIIKMATALNRRLEIRSILVEVGDLWPKQSQLADDEKTRVFKTWLRRLGILIKSFFIYVLVNLVAFDLSPFLVTCYSFAVGTNIYSFPFQPPSLWVVSNTAEFLATYALEIAATVLCQICLYIPYDLIVFSITANLSILLRLLQVDLRNAIKTTPGVTQDTESYAEIVRIVKIHQRILSIVERVNSIFGLVIFIHIFFSSLIICFFGFLTVVIPGVVGTIINSLTVFCAVVAIFLLTLTGQLLYDTSSGLADAAYHSLWYDSDEKVKKLVLLIMIRSQRPCYLSGLGYSEMTLHAFCKIMSSAWTYFSLLIQLYREN